MAARRGTWNNKNMGVAARIVRLRGLSRSGSVVDPTGIARSSPETGTANSTPDPILKKPDRAHNEHAEGVMNPLLKSLAETVCRSGNLLITDASGNTHRYGDGTGRPVHLSFNTRSAEWAVALDPGLKMGEAYMDGQIDLVEGTIFDLIALILSNSGELAGEDTFWMKPAALARIMARRITQANSIRRSRTNVHHHYDLSGTLYDLFLDEDRQYSCAYFTAPDDDLDSAQRAKKRHIAAKLCIDRPGLDVLDIGSGWGGLGLYLANNLGAEVKGVTLSEEQHAYSNAQAAEAGMADHACFELQDYRVVDVPFDRIVSVGMFEHVGRYHYDIFFDKAARLLKEDGVMLLHTIGRSRGPTYTNPFIDRYIFPGGYIPALSEVMAAIERSGLLVTDIEILRLHYAETLRHWRERFAARRDDAKALYDERFCRMWEFYLAGSEAAFRWQNLVVFQIQLAHRQDAVPLTRRYLDEQEGTLAELERGRREEWRMAG